MLVACNYSASHAPSTQAGEAFGQQAEEAVGVEVDADPGVLRTPGAPPQIDHGAPAAELGGAVDLDVAPLGADEVPADDVRDGHRVVHGRAVPGVDVRVEARVEGVQLGHEGPDPAGRAQPLGVGGREQRLVGDVEPDHRHVQAGGEDP